MRKTLFQKTIATYHKQKDTLGNIFFFVMLSLSVTSLMVLYIDRLPSNIREGAIATQDIKADQNYELIDSKSTASLKNEAAASVLPVYDFDANEAGERIQKIHDSFVKVRSQFSAEEELSESQENELKQSFLLNLGITLAEPEYQIIRKKEFSDDLENSLAALVEPIQKKPIIYDKSELAPVSKPGVVMRIQTDQMDPSEQIMTEFNNLLSFQQAKDFFKEMSVADLQKQFNLEFVDKENVELAVKLMPFFIKPNFTLNDSETDFRRERARSNIQNIIYKLQKGQMIIRSGDRYEPWHISVLEGIRAARLQTNVVVRFLGVLSLVLILLMTINFFAFKYLKKFTVKQKDLYFMGVVLVGFLAFLRMGSFMASGLQDAMPFAVDIKTFYYLIPIAAGGMLVRYILNSETAFVFSVLLSLFAGLFLDNSLEMTIYYFVSSVLATNFIGHVEKRSSVLLSGLYSGAVNVALVISLNLINKISTAANLDVANLITNCSFAFMGGIFSALTMLAISPIIETIFNYTTNIHLLELANMNHPLLREMIVRAPGTYHHSQLVGILAEAGARAINANPLLVRVASYYHDIGKMKKPQYFIENQKGDNPHDRLSPSMSALIIEAHVKDGLDMAKEHKLPKVIVDMIPEHQGTKLIGYFYQKAKKIAEANGTTIDESDYRYKGPKPQTREGGVIMLADTIEAAVRSMPEKNPDKIQAMVEKLVNMHFVDGQLNECDLTLRDLSLIAEAFVKILIGIYHQRVEYPDTQKKASLKALPLETHETLSSPGRQQASVYQNISPLFKEKNL